MNVVSLSSLGVVVETPLKLKKLYGYFLVSDYSQTNMYNGKIYSLKYILQQNHGKDDTTTITSIRQALLDYLDLYFVTVDVVVAIENKVIDIAIDVTDETGESYSLHESVKNNINDLYNNMGSMYYGQ